MAVNFALPERVIIIITLPLGHSSVSIGAASLRAWPSSSLSRVAECWLSTLSAPIVTHL